LQLDAPTLGVLNAAPFIILFIYIILRARSGELAKKLEPISAAFGGELVKDYLGHMYESTGVALSI